MVEPAQVEGGEDLAQVEVEPAGAQPEVDVADDVVEHPVRPGTDDDAAVLARHLGGGVAAHRGEMVEIGRQQQVVPAGHDQRRHPHRSVPPAHREPSGELVAAWIGKNIPEEGDEAGIVLAGGRQGARRQVTRRLLVAVDGVDQRGHRRRQLGGPSLGADHRRQTDRLQ